MASKKARSSRIDVINLVVELRKRKKLSRRENNRLKKRCLGGGNLKRVNNNGKNVRCWLYEKIGFHRKLLFLYRHGDVQWAVDNEQWTVDEREKYNGRINDIHWSNLQRTPNTRSEKVRQEVQETRANTSVPSTGSHRNMLLNDLIGWKENDIVSHKSLSCHQLQSNQVCKSSSSFQRQNDENMFQNKKTFKCCNLAPCSLSRQLDPGFSITSHTVHLADKKHSRRRSMQILFVLLSLPGFIFFRVFGNHVSRITHHARLNQMVFDSLPLWHQKQVFSLSYIIILAV